jgi:hypothetical protein
MGRGLALVTEMRDQSLKTILPDSGAGLVEGKEEAVAATDGLTRLSRDAIRQRFEERFNSRNGTL